MPGVKEESIGIKFDENYILIEGEGKEGRPYLIVERLENDVRPIINKKKFDGSTLELYFSK